MKKQGAQVSFITADSKIRELNQRIKVLEEAVFRKPKRIRATEAQRFLIHYHQGFVEPLLQSELNQGQKALHISVSLDIDPDNARKFLSEVGQKVKPLLHTESNYTFLTDYFEKIGNKEIEKECALILSNIQKANEKKKTK